MRKNFLTGFGVPLVVGAMMTFGPMILASSAQASTVGMSLTSSMTLVCTGTTVLPSDNLVAKVSTAVAGTTFCLQAGTYSIGTSSVKPKDNQKLIGVAPVVGADGSISAASKIVGTGAAIIDVGRARGVVIENLDISGANGVLACKPICGRGISQGVNLTVSYSRIHDNDSTGIGGGGSGMLLSHLEVDHDGSLTFADCCSGGVKSAHAYTIDSSYVHDNIGNGVWQDICGQNFVVTNNHLTRNTYSGARYEHSSSCAGSATITGNLVTGNNLALKGGAAGIAVNSAPGAFISNNTMGNNNKFGISIGGTRGPLTGTTIQNSTMNGDVLKGCALAVVTCSNNN